MNNDTITVNGYGKINLALDVLGKLPGGYHEVMMIMQQIELCDKITVSKTGRGKREIIITTNKDGVPTDHRNLAHRAAQIMLGLFEILDGVNIHIEKTIPMEAGLAGGSADCAATLIAINRLFDMRLSIPALCKIGARLGSDVPFCILGGAAVATGRGTRLTPVKGLAPDKYALLLCKPPQGMSTGGVYGRYSERWQEMSEKKHPDIIRLVGGMAMDASAESLAPDMINVLEYVVTDELPVVGEIRHIMEEEGAVPSLMTGSGSAVFGIFSDEEKAQKAYERLAPRFEETFLTKLR